MGELIRAFAVLDESEVQLLNTGISAKSARPSASPAENQNYSPLRGSGIFRDENFFSS